MNRIQRLLTPSHSPSGSQREKFLQSQRPTSTVPLCGSQFNIPGGQDCNREVIATSEHLRSVDLSSVTSRASNPGPNSFEVCDENMS